MQGRSPKPETLTLLSLTDHIGHLLTDSQRRGSVSHEMRMQPHSGNCSGLHL